MTRKQNKVQLNTQEQAPEATAEAQSPDKAAAQPDPAPPLTLKSPRVDFLEGEEAFVLLADLPGVQPDQLNIQLEGQELSLEATRHASEGSLLEATLFRRKISLPQEVEADAVAATLKDGVLRVDLPRAAASRPRQIQIQA